MNDFDSLVQQHRYEIYRYLSFFLSFFLNAPTLPTVSFFRDSFILVQKGKTIGASHFSSCIFPSFFFCISSKDRKYSRIARYNYTERRFLSRDRAVCYRIIYNVYYITELFVTYKGRCRKLFFRYLSTTTRGQRKNRIHSSV